MQIFGLDFKGIAIIKAITFLYSVSFFYRYSIQSNSVGAIRFYNIILYVFVFIIICGFFSYLEGRVPIHVYFSGIVSYIFPLCILFWTFNQTIVERKVFIRKIVFGLFIFCVVGLLLYFWSPAWYVNWRISMYSEWVGGENAENFLTASNNLSSVSNHPYFVGYTTVFLLSISLYNIYRGKSKNKYFVLFIIALLTQILAQQRVSIVLSLIMIVIYSVVGIKNGNKSFLLIVVLLVISGIMAFIKYYDAIDFLITRYSSVSSGAVMNDGRFDLGYELLNSDYNCLFGEGFNKVGHASLRYGLKCIGDAEWQKMLYEIGYFGFSVFYIMLLFPVLLAYRYKCYVELPVVVFYLFATYGANPFENDNIILIYWINIGFILKNVHLICKKHGINNEKAYEVL